MGVRTLRRNPYPPVRILKVCMEAFRGSVTHIAELVSTPPCSLKAVSLTMAPAVEMAGGTGEKRNLHSKV